MFYRLAALELLDYGAEVRGCEVRHKILWWPWTTLATSFAPRIDDCDFGERKISAVAGC